MTEDKLEKLTALNRRISNLTSWLNNADRMTNAKAKLDCLFEVNGCISESTLQKCYDLCRPELDEALLKLRKEWEEV